MIRNGVIASTYITSAMATQIAFIVSSWVKDNERRAVVSIY